MAIEKKLIHFNKKESFLTELSNNNILQTSIVFIKDSQEIWTHGQFYPCPYNKEELDTLIKNIQNQLDTLEVDKANIEDLSNIFGEEVIDPPLLEEINLLTREQIKKDLFIDMWDKACGIWGKYDYENAPDKNAPFYLNELWLTYDEAIPIYQLWNSIDGCNGITNFETIKLSHINFKTLIPFGNGGAYHINRILRQWIFDYSNFINIRLNRDCNEKNANTYLHIIANRFNNPLFRSGVRLEKWLDFIKVMDDQNNVNTTTIDFTQAQIGSDKFYHFRLMNLNSNLTTSSPALDIDTWRYLVDNRTPSTNQYYNPITITVRQNIYNALQGQDTEYPFNGGTQEEWEQLLQDAIAKDISFATV